MKGYIRGMLVSILVVMLCMPSMMMASEGNNAKLDAVLVIDASGSMKETDPNKLGLEGVKLFVDMMAATGNQVGIVTYGSEVGSTYPMTKVNTQDDKEKIKSYVDGISRELEYTDITAGLGKAIEMEDQRDTSLGNSPLIIIFTDGNNAVGGVAGRDNQKIDADLSQMISKSQSAGYPIYTIGLNDNGKLNEAYLKKISDQTSALAFATKDPTELPDILTKIFAAHSNLKVQTLGTLQGKGDFEEVTVNVPNDNVYEANISATSSQPITFQLTDPAGNSKTIPSSDVTLHESQSYHLLKISKPMEGDWKLGVKGMPGDQINIDLVYNYDMEVTMKPLNSTQFGKGDTLDVSAYLSLQGNSVDDDALYQTAKPTLILKNTASGNEQKVAMAINGQSFEGSCKLKEEGAFEVSVLVEDTSYQRQSSPVMITVGKGGSAKAAMGKAEKAQGKSSVLMVGIGVVILGVIAAAIVLMKKLQDVKRPLVGQMVVEVRDNATGRLTPPQYKKLSVFQGKTSLHALLQFAPELKASEQIIFKSLPGDKVMMINESDYVIEKSGRAVKADSGVVLKKGDRFSINLADSGQTIQLEYLL